jgi:hypothetical protein
MIRRKRISSNMNNMFKPHRSKHNPPIPSRNTQQTLILIRQQQFQDLFPRPFLSIVIKASRLADIPRHDFVVCGCELGEI